MKKSKILLSSVLLFTLILFAQEKTTSIKKAKVNYDSFEKLVEKVKDHRKKRLVTLETFNAMSTQKNTIILDTRSKQMYDSKHIKGALHLNFSDFTEASLASLIPDKNTRILIYCNNNIEDDSRYFMTKSVTPKLTSITKEPLTLALNIPTYINLYGYGYRNVYELSELISVFDQRIEFEGTAVPKTITKN